MYKNKNASQNRRQIRYVTHIEKILSELLKTKKILFYKEAENPNPDILSYRISHYKDHFFFLQIMFAKSFHPIGGVEFGESKYDKLIILVDPKPFKIIKNKVKEIILANVEERKSGLILENVFCNAIKVLIGRDREVRELISEIEHSKKVDDILKIDFFVLLKSQVKMPLQIKSGFLRQKEHKNNYESKIPSLIYSPHMSLDILKNKILKICKSYLKNEIEHI